MTIEEQSESLVDRLNEMHHEVKMFKLEHPELRKGFRWCYAGVLNAYREGDLEFSDAVKAIEDICKGVKNE